jgi:hypothetical protein
MNREHDVGLREGKNYVVVLAGRMMRAFGTRAEAERAVEEKWRGGHVEELFQISGESGGLTWNENARWAPWSKHL